MTAPSEGRKEGLSQSQEHYSTVLCELWSGYAKLLHVGMAAAGLTVLAIGQYLNSINVPLGQLGLAVKASVLFAGLAGISFALCRWLTQVIMERQVYGPRGPAESYFSESETRPPNALRYSPATLQWFYTVNDLFKYLGASSLLLSWIFIVFVMFRWVDNASLPH